jgi:hypothetical protein
MTATSRASRGPADPSGAVRKTGLAELSVAVDGCAATDRSARRIGHVNSGTKQTS